MEWMVTILGLDDVFRTSSGKGGGIIGVSRAAQAELQTDCCDIRGQARTRACACVVVLRLPRAQC